jgi:hypothetical protein
MVKNVLRMKIKPEDVDFMLLLQYTITEKKFLFYFKMILIGLI